MKQNALGTMGKSPGLDPTSIVIRHTVERYTTNFGTEHREQLKDHIYTGGTGYSPMVVL